MLKKIKQVIKKPKQKKNTINLKYQSSLEENIKQKDEIIELQKKIITLQEDNVIYQKVIIEELKKDIVKEKLKYKKLKENK